MKKPRKFLVFFLLFVSVCIKAMVYTPNAYLRVNWAAVNPYGCRRNRLSDLLDTSRA